SVLHPILLAGIWIVHLRSPKETQQTLSRERPSLRTATCKSHGGAATGALRSLQHLLPSASLRRQGTPPNFLQQEAPRSSAEATAPSVQVCSPALHC
ncbi:hypothetical protein LEMLEM_LOCUS22003, partial [Lemmus lemmus]